jgi:PAS domain S-box-containing protein
MWEKVVLNLLSNAFKFTFHGEIDIRLQQNENRVELSVRDTGIGIPPEEMPRMFERFHRVEKARGRTHEGSGIGLALVQELVKLHGGTITAASVLGAGTTFTVAIPLGLAHLPADQIGDYRNPDSLLAGAMPYVEEALRWLPDDEPRTGPSELPSYHESVPSPHLGAKPEEDANRPRVLIADDNADMRQYIARLLAERHQVETAPDGEAALAAARKEPPDLIVTDVMMPRLDGFGLLRELRADVRTRDVPVIMLSARAGEESRVEGMEAGADDYVVKPFSARELLARVSAHLQMARMRRETSETLREGEERLSMALTAAHMVAWQYEPSTHKVVVSDNAASVFGLLPEFKLENIDLGISLLHPDDGARHRAIMMKAVEEGTNYLSEYRIIRPVDHTTIWLEERGHAVRGGPGEGVRLVGVVMDITERKRAEDAMRRQSEQLGQLAEVATRFNAAHDVDSITAVVTEEARTLIRSHQAVTSFSIDQNWGQAINVVCLSEKYAAWRGYDEKPDGTGIYALVCRTNKSMRLTQAELEAHPNYKWFGKHAQHHPPLRGWLAAPLVGRDGRNLGLIQLSDKYEGEFSEEDEAILVQLAQMASVAIEKGRLVQDLLEADRRKDEFLATLAHELRNPLAPLRNGLQLMKLAQANPGNKLSVDLVEQARLLMERQLGQMVRLVDDLLDVSRISRGKVILQKSRIALAMAIENALETSRSLIEAAGHELTLDLPSEPVFVDADETRLSQIFANLLNNAAKYTDPGGRIRVAVEREEREVIVSVEDNGVGIPAPMLARVFEMFTQVDRSLEKSQGGLGIGLTIVKRLIELHGGTIEARSEGHGLGSQFIVRLPVAQELPGRPEDNGDKDEIAVARRRRILVVDDNRDSAVSLAMMLEIMGNVTKTAHDGLEALDVAATFRPDVVLLDIGMPRLNGYDAARRIREQPWGREMVLVAQTGWGQEEDKRRSREAGFNFHMVKPLDPAALEKLLGELQQSQG